MNAGANLLSILYDLCIKSCNLSVRCVKFENGIWLNSRPENKKSLHSIAVDSLKKTRKASFWWTNMTKSLTSIRVSESWMVLHSRKREWVRGEPIAEIKTFPKTSAPCQTYAKSWRVGRRSCQPSWPLARRRWGQGAKSWNLRCGAAWSFVADYICDPFAEFQV